MELAQQRNRVLLTLRVVILFGKVLPSPLPLVELAEPGQRRTSHFRRQRPLREEPAAQVRTAAHEDQATVRLDGDAVVASIGIGLER